MGWDIGVERKNRLAYRVGRLNALSIHTDPIVDFRWDFEGVVEDCSGDLCPGVDGSGCNLSRGI